MIFKAGVKQVIMKANRLAAAMFCKSTSKDVA
jgi:hypothetical protein